MPRKARIDRGDLCYHVLNRGNERQAVYRTEAEYASFLQLLQRAKARLPMRVLAFCLMPNHFHLCLWPYHDGDLGRFMQWLTTAHVAQFRKTNPGVGHVWQGRFKAFPVQLGVHLFRVLRYIERNPVRAKLAQGAREWPWSSASQVPKLEIAEWPVPKPKDWIDSLSIEQPVEELEALQQCVLGSSPFGELDWIARERLGD